MTNISHDAFRHLKDQFDRGVVGRREFLRLTALLGIGMGSAYAAIGQPLPAQAAEQTPFPPADPDAKHGGVLRVGHTVAAMDDPATYSWSEMTNQTRPILEGLFELGHDNIIRPALVQSWSPSNDLKTWTFNLRRGVTWHNGDEFVAQQVAWNIERWTRSANGSPNIGLSTFTALSRTDGGVDKKGRPTRLPQEGAIEIVDPYTIRLHLSVPVLSVAEDFAEKTALIAHPSFVAPFSNNPVGTGPFTLAQLKVGDRCVLKRVSKTSSGMDFKYWGGDVYLDEIHFFNFESENRSAALASGSIDVIEELTVDQLEFAKSIEGAQVLSTNTANTLCCRMQIDQKPFDDIRVRKAIVKGVDNASISTLLFPEGGAPAYNYHVSPMHPEYASLPPLSRDVEGAKALLAEAGYTSGLDITITTGNTDGSFHQATAEALRDQLKDIGVNLAINVLPSTKFWEVWDKAPFGTTPWVHRPLGTMVLAQAYRSGVPWNETHFSNAEFDQLLMEAQATVDVEKRKTIMKKLEIILQDAALMVQPYWRPIYSVTTTKVKGYSVNPARIMQLTKVWLDA